MANKRKDGPHWVKAWIADLSMLTDSFRDMNTGAVNFEALGKEEYLFRMALSRKDFSLSTRAKKVWDEAVGPYNQRITAANKKSPQDAPNGNAGVDVTDAGNGAASKSPTSCGTFTADGDTREDSQARPDGSAITRNETRAHDALEPSANHYGDTREHSRGRYAPPSCSPDDGKLYGDSATREGAEAVNSRESGATAPTTVSRNMRRVPQNEAPAHGFSGGRTAQGTMSRSPEAAAQSGKAYDQEPYRVSTDKPQPEGLTGPSHGGSVASLEARQGQALESQRRAGADSVRGTPLHRAPARQQAKNSRCPNSREDFHAFVADNNLHEGLAEEWYAMHEAREWVDRDGKPIKDWRGALYNYCTKTEQKRRTA